MSRDLLLLSGERQLLAAASLRKELMMREFTLESTGKEGFGRVKLRILQIECRGRVYLFACLYGYGFNGLIY